MNNPLLTTLQIVSFLCAQSATAAELQGEFSLSIATLKRHLAEARLLGADIESSKLAMASTYHLKNKDAVSVRVHRWIELETSRDLRDSHKQ